MKIKELRKAAGLTQCQLAKLVGVTQSAVAAWERGDYYPSAPMLLKLATALGCTVNDLYRTDTENTA